jgi:hypothetical protein
VRQDVIPISAHILGGFFLLKDLAADIVARLPLYLTTCRLSLTLALSLLILLYIPINSHKNGNLFKNMTFSI